MQWGTTRPWLALGFALSLLATATACGRGEGDSGASDGGGAPAHEMPAAGQTSTSAPDTYTNDADRPGADYIAGRSDTPADHAILFAVEKYLNEAGLGDVQVRVSHRVVYLVGELPAARYDEVVEGIRRVHPEIGRIDASGLKRI